MAPGAGPGSAAQGVGCGGVERGSAAAAADHRVVKPSGAEAQANRSRYRSKILDLDLGLDPRSGSRSNILDRDLNLDLGSRSRS